jgi:hypothetical protein
MRRLMAVLLAATFVAGCGADKVASPEDNSNGTWNLTTLDGKPLPFNAGTFSGTTVELVAEKIVISGSAYTVTATIRQTTNGQATTSSESDAGNFSRVGTTGKFQSTSDGSIATGTFNGSNLTINDGTSTYVFVR